MGGMRKRLSCLSIPKSIIVLAMIGASALACFVLFALVGCGTKPIVDDASPRCIEARMTAGSDLTEASQYVEVRLVFDRMLEAAKDVASDFDVKVNGEYPDDATMQVTAWAEGTDVVIRLVPTAAANGEKASVYYALYDGLISIAAREADGALARVKAAEGSSNAVLDEQHTLTVPSGIEICVLSSVPGDEASLTQAACVLEVRQFAQLRCCTWLSLGEGLPTIMMHNHEFLRDTVQTCAKRMAETISSTCGSQFDVQTDGARITLRSRTVVDGQILDPCILAGEGVDPSAEQEGASA